MQSRASMSVGERKRKFALIDSMRIPERPIKTTAGLNAADFFKLAIYEVHFEHSQTQTTPCDSIKDVMDFQSVTSACDDWLEPGSACELALVFFFFSEVKPGFSRSLVSPTLSRALWCIVQLPFIAPRNEINELREWRR